jgi:hypothetical protein
MLQGDDTPLVVRKEATDSTDKEWAVTTNNRFLLEESPGRWKLMGHGANGPRWLEKEKKRRKSIEDDRDRIEEALKQQRVTDLFMGSATYPRQRRPNPRDATQDVPENAPQRAQKKAPEETHKEGLKTVPQTVKVNAKPS